MVRCTSKSETRSGEYYPECNFIKLNQVGANIVKCFKEPPPCSQGFGSMASLHLETYAIVAWTAGSIQQHTARIIEVFEALKLKGNQGELELEHSIPTIKPTGFLVLGTWPTKQFGKTNLERKFEVFSAPDVEPGIVSPEPLEELPVDGEEATGHGRAVNGLGRVAVTSTLAFRYSVPVELQKMTK